MSHPDDPKWWQVLDGQIARTSDARSTRRSIGVNYPVELYPLVLEAARQRDMSMTGYQRRAALAFAQFDLSFDWALEMKAEPPISTFVAGAKPQPMEGHGFGPWRIINLGDHA